MAVLGKMLEGYMANKRQDALKDERTALSQRYGEELMQVKRDCGFGDQDALEVYPSDEDVFNSGNIRHLYFVGPVFFALRKNTHVLPQSNTHG